MATPVNVSPLIKTMRWGLLSLGIFYGVRHKETVKQWRAEERVVEREIKEKMLKDEVETKRLANLEFERHSILYGYSDENPGVVVDGKVVPASAVEGGCQ